MKAKEVILEEKRIPTGVRGTTIPDPSAHDAYGFKVFDRYSGKPEGIHLGDIQERNYEALQAILQRNGDAIKYIGYLAYEGEPAYNANKNRKPKLTRFVGVAKNLVWEKYEGITAGGGQNRVYVGNRMMKLNEFLALPPKKQDALLSMDASAGLADQIASIPKDKQNTKAMVAAYNKQGKFLGLDSAIKMRKLAEKGWGNINDNQKIWFAKRAFWIK